MYKPDHAVNLVS